MLDESLRHVSVWTAAGVIVTVWGLLRMTSWLNDERKIWALGGHARRVRGLPWSLDFIYKSIQATKNNRVMDHWSTTFREANSYTVEIHPGGRRMVLTADPDNIKAILASQFDDYGKGDTFRREWHDFLGDSFFTQDGSKWRDSRQMLRPLFVKDRVADLDLFERHVQRLLPKMGGAGQQVDLASLIFRFTMDAACDFLFAADVNSLESPKELEFVKAFTGIQQMQALIINTGPLNKYIPRGEFYKNIAIVDAFLNPHIDRALQLRPDELETKAKSDKDYSFLHAMVGLTRDRQVIRDQMLAILQAGRDTTACTLSWIFYELSRNPDMVAKLQREILSHVGPSQAPTYADLKSMRFLQHTINEALRLYPVVPINARLALRDTTLPHGGGPDGNAPVGILKETPIIFSPFCLQRRPDLYPAELPVAKSNEKASKAFPDPASFCPERWDTWTPRPWTYVPFNGGPRICQGQQFALAEIGFVVVRVLQHFDRVTPGFEGDVPLKTVLVMQPGVPLDLTFWDRE